MGMWIGNHVLKKLGKGMCAGDEKKIKNENKTEDWK